MNNLTEKELLLSSFSLKIYGPAHKVLLLIALGSSKGSDKPVHTHSLESGFTSSIHKVWK